MKNFIAALLAYFASGIFTTVAQQPGSLDNSFDADGKVLTDVGGIDAGAYSIAVQADGKIIAAGASTANDSVTNNPVMVRYDTNGKIDSSFGLNGIAIINPGNQTGGGITDISIQNDGKIVAAGYFYYDTTYNDFLIARFLPDGSLDSSFAGDGMIILDFIGETDEAWAVASLANGKIIVGGYARDSFQSDLAIVKFNTDGTLDNSFGSNGKVVIDFGADEEGLGMAIQPDGKIVVAGYSDDGSSVDYAVARCNSNGTLDNSFGTGGKVITDLGSDDEYAARLALQPDGKIVVCGYSNNGSNSDYAMVRYSANGTLDITFGTNGIVKTNGNGGDEMALALVLQPDGKIVLAGTSGYSFDSDFAALRYNPDGTTDSSFGTNGKVLVDFGGDEDECWAAALQPDGGILVAGSSNAAAPEYEIATARLLRGLSTGTLDFGLQENMLVYPNPIQQHEVLEYTLEQDEVLSIALYDINGRLIQPIVTEGVRSKGAHKESLNFNEALIPGHYFLTMTNGSGNVSIKITKQ